MQPIILTTTDASGGTTYSRKARMDGFAGSTTVIQVTVTGTATYTVETSMDDPNSATNPVAEGSMTWLYATDSAVVNKTAKATGILIATPTFIRVKQTAGNGSTSATMVQAGSVPY